MTTQQMLEISLAALEIYRTLIEDALLLLKQDVGVHLPPVKPAIQKLHQLHKLLTEDIDTAPEPLVRPADPSDLQRLKDLYHP